MKARPLLKNAEERLLAAGVPDAKWDAEQLLSFVTGREPMMLRLKDDEVPPDMERAFLALLERRDRREPLQYITGEQWFMGLPFAVTESVLIPRYDTEAMCEEAIGRIPENARVLDLCTGSGAIAVAVKKARPDIEMYASDLSAEALSVAKENAAKNGCDISFFEGDLFAPFKGIRFDIILSNPPYIPAGELAGLQREVQLEPRMALDGGGDGLCFYRRIAAEAPSHLKPEGLLILETGDGQEKDVSALLRKDFDQIECRRDLSGRIRSVWARLRTV
ncbi:MAG: peptide chain release factor N(5)-glutamine methyltransferase [Clostridiales bacterium]|nr:peptide chain release factor N(5)-glutamine methyltransferase [Clostridiales bacterium]